MPIVASWPPMGGRRDQSHGYPLIVPSMTAACAYSRGVVTVGPPSACSVAASLIAQRTDRGCMTTAVDDGNLAVLNGDRRRRVLRSRHPKRPAASSAPDNRLPATAAGSWPPIARSVAVSACQPQSIRSLVLSRGAPLLIATDRVALSYQLLDLSLAIRPTDFRFAVADTLTCEYGAAGSFRLVNVPPYRLSSQNRFLRASSLPCS
jgi:hypothetical protein